MHPLELADADARAWWDLFADHEIIQPFAQLGRTVFTPGISFSAAIFDLHVLAQDRAPT